MVSEIVSRHRGTAMAVACGTVVALSLGAMYVMGKDTKEKEGAISLYQSDGKGSDLRMTSSDVSATVSIPKPGVWATTRHGPMRKGAMYNMPSYGPM
ncbi:hypothetical protein AX17_004645 [Amanita inopinata Kibby_2008]|nr:hypothetical protein AX17_004645 [Amanita inopinata Kibby_2008]